MANEAVLSALSAIVTDAPLQNWADVDSQLTTLAAHLNDDMPTGGIYGNACVMRIALVQGREFFYRRDATNLVTWATAAQAYFQ